MRIRRQYSGFSLTEVLLAVGTLAVGMIFISGTFLTGIYFSTISTERSIAAVVADEAFAKLRLHGIDPTGTNLTLSQQTPFESLNPIAVGEFAYPSTKTLTEKHYFWSALCRPVYSDANNRLVQVTVFISRKVGSTTTYPPNGAARPIPVQVGVTGAVGDRVLTVTGDMNYINDGYTIVENGTGQIYRVVERGVDPAHPEQITLAQDRLWQGGDSVWVIPPPSGGGKNPCIAVYQKLISF